MLPHAEPGCKACGGSGFVHLPPSPEYPNGADAVCRCVVRNNRRRRAVALMARSGLDEETMRRWSFETFHPEQAVARPEDLRRVAGVLATCRAYAREPRGWLVLVGVYGCGKSHLAYATAAEVFRAGGNVVVSTVPDLLEALRQGYAPEAATPGGGGTFDERFAAVRDADLAVLDDLGAHYATAWAAEKLYQIVDYRLRRRLPLIVTTNEDLSAPDCRIEPRVRSRLLEGTQCEDGFSRLLWIPAGDYRLRAAAPPPG